MIPRSRSFIEQSIVVPLAPYDENNHAPNESTKVSLYLAGVRAGMYLIEGLSHG